MPVAVITGASRGLGAELARFLAPQGFDLVLTARGRTDLERIAAELNGAGHTVIAATGDISDDGHRSAAVAAALSLGAVDLIVNNASELGPSPLPQLQDASPVDFRRILDINTVAPLALTTGLVPFMPPGGLIVNVSSDAARGGYEGWGLYGASKAALDLLSLTFANELRVRGIGVVAVDPGDMRTGMHQAAFPGEDISDRPLPSTTIPFWAWLLAQDPLAVSGHRFEAQADSWSVAA